MVNHAAKLIIKMNLVKQPYKVLLVNSTVKLGSSKPAQTDAEDGLFSRNTFNYFVH